MIWASLNRLFLTTPPPALAGIVNREVTFPMDYLLCRPYGTRVNFPRYPVLKHWADFSVPSGLYLP